MPKAPRLTAKQASLLRADLAQSGWGVESVEALLGPVAAAALPRSGWRGWGYQGQCR